MDRYAGRTSTRSGSALKAREITRGARPTADLGFKREILSELGCGWFDYAAGINAYDQLADQCTTVNGRFTHRSLCGPSWRRSIEITELRELT